MIKNMADHTLSLSIMLLHVQHIKPSDVGRNCVRMWCRAKDAVGWEAWCSPLMHALHTTHACIAYHPCRHRTPPMYALCTTHACIACRPRMHRIQPMHASHTAHACITYHPRMHHIPPMHASHTTHACITHHPCMHRIASSSTKFPFSDNPWWHSPTVITQIRASLTL